MTTIDDALDSMPARDLERLRERIDRRLQSCAIDGNDGAIACRVTAKITGNTTSFTLLLCRGCIEKNRLPESRAEEGPDVGDR